jgi:hypothetical protein
LLQIGHPRPATICDNTLSQIWPSELRFFERTATEFQLSWIDPEAEQRGIFIERADNVGEYVIPGTRMQVDGFHRESNTVYEYHGDDWHGNPAVCSRNDKPHPHNNKTAKQLFQETRAREKELVDLGYTVISVWENDFQRHGNSRVAEVIWVHDKKHFKFSKWTFAREFYE